MNNTNFRLILAASATALLSACAAVGVPGFGDGAGGCRTIYVVTGGGVQPVSNCGGLPRDTLMAQKSTKALNAPIQVDEGQPGDEPAKAPVTPVSVAAKATAPYDPVTKPYPGPNEMLENADMSAFMARVREDYSKKTNSGAWGYMIIDALAGDDPATAQQVLDALAGRPSPEMLSARHLRPWVLAANGRGADAQAEMAKARSVLPGPTLIGHRALLAEGLGDPNLALSIYAEVSGDFDAPSEADAQQPDYLMRLMAFNSKRLLALRHAELLRAVNRDQEAVALLSVLLASSPDDPYIIDRLAKARSGQDRQTPRTLKQALALAIADEADMVEESQNLRALMMGRGGKPPFNYLLSSLRQSALLLDPDNGDIRIAEAGQLYQQGKFEPALRISQIGNPPRAQQAVLMSTAGLAALELGSPETLEALTERSLKIDASAEAKIQAAGALTSAGRTERAVALIDQAMKQGGLTRPQQVVALIAKGQAQLQGGNVTGAVEAARSARALQDDVSTQQFLASMLVESPQRQEGLAIMRHMMTDQPENTSLMNNFGFSLIDGYASQDELDEGFKLLKQAIRLTPDEPNLLDSIGWAYYQYGDFREANRFIAMALEEYEPFAHWELSDHMGDVQWRLGDQEAARKAWQASLDAYPPAHNKAMIEGKIRTGLSTPAPSRRDTPEVPLNRDRGGLSDI